MFLSNEICGYILPKTNRLISTTIWCAGFILLYEIIILNSAHQVLAHTGRVRLIRTQLIRSST